MFVADTVALRASVDGEDLPTEFEVILTGTYKSRNFSLDEKMIDQIIANHKASGVDPAIDREHESWFASEATEARGWVKILSKRPSASDPKRTALVATVDWTDLGAEAVKRKYFRYVSAGIDFGAKDRLTGEKIGAFLDHVALVKHPFVQRMQPLANSAAEGGEGESTMSKLALMLGLAASVTDESALVAALEKRDAEHREALAKATKRAEDAEALLASLRAEGIKRELDAAVAAFRITPAERAHFEALAALDPKLFTALLAERKPQALNAQVAVAPKPAGGLGKLAAQEKAIDDEMSADPSISALKAYERAKAKQPALFEEGGVQ